MSPPPPYTRVFAGQNATADLRVAESVALAPDTTLLGAADAAVASVACTPAETAISAPAATTPRTHRDRANLVLDMGFSSVSTAPEGVGRANRGDHRKRSASAHEDASEAGKCAPCPVSVCPDDGRGTFPHDRPAPP